jgi:hypothetical protein
VTITYLNQISGFEVVDWTGVRVRKINKTAKAIVGTLKILAPKIDNTHTTDVQLYKKQGGQYRQLPFKSENAPACNTINADTFFYPEVVKHSDLLRPMPCPFPQVDFLYYF